MMMFRLASLLGRTVGELDEQLSEREFREWCAFYMLEPWGYEIESFWHAMGPFTALNIAAAQVGKRSRKRLEDFYRSDPLKRRHWASTEEILAAFGVPSPRGKPS